ncbi:thioesterase II family protein [Methylosinus sp. Sm6]|uniref:thioesterase II family protein n=1 Tax=Methylosinus sp. Sm6 TaxID=2866948 RepID=UPI001C99175F|nr:alpha/beta fold hydrolase [Methylosinus sp. Sm6]MBY6243607.1 alpha/beta fold hydrolase [Methylosinus sp. Sm6]
MTRTTNLTLYCFPCAGAGAAQYFPWRRLAPGWVRVQPLELPGRGACSRATLLRSFDEAVDNLTNAIAGDPRERFAFFGHSLGALLAYGCAHALRQRSRNLPIALFAAACSAPSKRDDARFAALDTDAKIIEEMRRLNGTPDAIFEHEELLNITLDLLRADFALCRDFSYRPRDRLPSPIFAIGGIDDEIELSALAAWAEETARPADVKMFEGGHFFFRGREAPVLDYVVGRLSAVTIGACP